MEYAGKIRTRRVPKGVNVRVHERRPFRVVRGGRSPRRTRFDSRAPQRRVDRALWNRITKTDDQVVQVMCFRRLRCEQENLANVKVMNEKNT